MKFIKVSFLILVVVIVFSNYTQEMSLNFNKFALCGKESPFGLSDSTIIDETGKTVRKSISHIIPRQIILKEDIREDASLANILMSSSCPGWTSYDIHSIYSSNITLTMDFIELNDFDYPTDINSTAELSSKTTKVKFLQGFLYEWERTDCVYYPQTHWGLNTRVTGIDNILLSIAAQQSGRLVSNNIITITETETETTTETITSNITNTITETETVVNNVMDVTSEETGLNKTIILFIFLAFIAFLASVGGLIKYYYNRYNKRKDELTKILNYIDFLSFLSDRLSPLKKAVDQFSLRKNKVIRNVSLKSQLNNIKRELNDLELENYTNQMKKKEKTYYFLNEEIKELDEKLILLIDEIAFLEKSLEQHKN